MSKDHAGDPAKPKGWFSRRHQTNEAHLRAKERRMARRLDRPKQRWDKAAETWIKDPR